MRIKNNTAFSLLEVLLAAIIFIISVAGIFVTLNAVRVPVANKENQLAAAVFGKQVLEALYSQVNGKSWPPSCLGVPNADGSCPDFSLSILPAAPAGLHEVSSANLLTSAGLSWPSALTTTPCSATPVLTYTVFCGDGSTGVACANNAQVGRGVNLNIQWPNLETGTC